METERTASFLNCMKTIRRKDSPDTNFELDNEDMSRFYFREGHCTVACIGMIIKNKQDIRIENFSLPHLEPKILL